MRKGILLLIEKIREGKIEEVEALLKNGMSPFLMVDGNCGFREAAIRGELGLVRRFFECEGAKESILKVIEGPYEEVELDIEIDKIDLIGLAEMEHLDINVSEDELQIPEGVEIKDGNRYIYKSYNNTLLHSVCKSEKFNIEVLDTLLRIGGAIYMDSVNNLLQSPERSIELNIFLDGNKKRLVKAEFRKIREERVKEIVLERMRLESKRKRIIEYRRRYFEILSNGPQNIVMAQQNAVVAEKNRQQMLQQMIKHNEEGIINAIIVPSDVDNDNRKRDIPLADNGRRKRRRKYADGVDNGYLL